METSFKAAVLKIVNSIPKGKLMSYGQIAAAAGSPRSARQVGGILSKFDGSYDLPWWRVVNHKGLITIKGNAFSTSKMQKELLEVEGIVVDDDLKIDIKKYRYFPT